MLTLQYLPYTEIAGLDADRRVEKILGLVKKNRIVLLEGKLKHEEETELIKQTMESIDDDFKGIELGSIEPSTKESQALLEKIKKGMASILLGDRVGMTIIGPASIVKEIKQDPEKIQVFTEIQKKKGKK